MPITYAPPAVTGEVQRFQPNFAYKAGDLIIQTVSGSDVAYYAIDDFTSSATFSNADWTPFPVNATNAIPISAIGAAGGVVPLNTATPPTIDQTYLATTPATQVVMWTMAGDAAVGNGRWSPPTPTAGVIQSVQNAAETGPDGRAIIMDYETMAGGTLFTTPSHRPQIPLGSTGPQKSSLTVPDVTTFPIGTQFRPVVAQVGIQPGSVAPFVAGRATEATTTATTKSVSVPSGVQNGDFMVVSIRSTSVAPDTVPSGWTLISANGAGGGSFWTRRYWKLYAGEVGPYTWDFTTAGSQNFGNTSIVWVRNPHQTSPLDSSSSVFVTATTGAMTPAALTTVNDGSLVLYFWTTASSVTSTTGVPSGYTTYTGFTAASVAHLAYATQATAGALTTPTVTPSISTAATITRVAVRAQPAPTVWTPGVNLTAALRYRET